MTTSELIKLFFIGGQLVDGHKQPRGLPTDLRTLLESGEVLICGSAIGLDIRKLARAPVNRLVDTRKVFDFGVRHGHWDNVSRSGRKSGLGIQAVTVFGTLNAYLKADYEDKRVRQFEPPYPEGFLDDSWRHPLRLYDWGRKGQCLQDRQRLYLFVDALTPIFLILQLLSCVIDSEDVDEIIGMTSAKDMFLTKFPSLLFSTVIDVKPDPEADRMFLLAPVDRALAGPELGAGIAGSAQADLGQVTGNGTSESQTPDLGDRAPEILALQEKVTKPLEKYLKCVFIVDVVPGVRTELHAATSVCIPSSGSVHQSIRSPPACLWRKVEDQRVQVHLSNLHQRLRVLR